MNESGHKTVLVLGGGYAGVRCALDLDKRLPSDWRIVLIDKSEDHNVHTLLYEVATMVFSQETREGYERERSHALISYRDIFHDTRVEVVRGEFVTVSFEDKNVSVKLAHHHHGLTFGIPGERVRVPYEYVVFALGSETNYFNILGLHGAYGLRNTSDALNIRSAVLEAIDRNKNSDTHIVIGGAGLTGVELAAELSGMAKRIAKISGINISRINISVVEAKQEVLSGASTWVQDKATARLSSLGVHIMLGTRIEGYDGTKITLSEQRKIKADVFVWTGGVRATRVSEQMQSHQAGNCDLVADSYLHIEDCSGAYVAGDTACYLPALSRPQYHQATSRRAVATGRLVAKNIANEIEGKPPERDTATRPLWLIPVGGKYVICEFGKLRFSGVTAWVVKMLSQLWYLLTIVPLGHALPIWLQSMRTYIRND